MITLATIFGAVGAILLLVGLVGGGFTFSGSVMPKVGSVARVLCFSFGGLLLVTALGLAFGGEALRDTRPVPGPAPATVASASTMPTPTAASAASFIGYVLVPAGYQAHVFELPTTSSAVVTSLGNDTAVEIICTVQGESMTSPVTGYTSSLWNGTTDGGFIPDVFVDTGTNQPTMPNCLN